MPNKLSFLLLSFMLICHSVVLPEVPQNHDSGAGQDQILVKKIRKNRKQKKEERLKKCRGALKYQLISKPIRDQNVSELKNNFTIYLQLDNDHLAVKYLEALIAKLDDFAQIRDFRLQLADLYFKNEQYLKAGSIYLEYYESYPGYIQAEYALSQAILAKFKQMGACDQDNVVTNEVLELSQKYLQNKSYKKYRTKILELFESCNNQLFEAEVHIFEHYFRQGYLVAAQRRLDYMRDKIMPKMTHIKDRLQAMQGLIDQAKAGKNPLKLLKRMHYADQNVRIDRETALKINKQKPYVSQF